VYVTEVYENHAGSLPPNESVDDLKRGEKKCLICEDVDGRSSVNSQIQKFSLEMKPYKEEDIDVEDVDVTMSVDSESIPMTVTLGVVAAFIFLGSVLFGIWEGWPPLEAAYYCFVTISTIGFGDIVPGSTSFDDSGQEMKMIGAAVYILVGLALLSMAFNLIQEVMTEKWIRFGRKMGLVDEDSTG